MINATCPIERIPLELLCKVFEECIDSYQEMSPNKAPLIFLSVCKLWRAAALAHSRLWTEFSITLSPCGPVPPLSTLLLWSSSIRTSNVNICVRVEKVSPHPDHALSGARSRLQLLNSQVSCDLWKNAALTLPASSDFLQGLFDDCHPTRLESLRLDLRGWDTAGIQHLATFFQSVPSLRDLECSDTDHHGVSKSPTAPFLLESNIPWHSLTRISLNVYTSLESTHLILSQCKDLEILDLFRFAVGGHTHESMSHYEAISLPHLRSLTIRQRTLDDGLAALFDLLVCPKLIRLDVGTTDISVPWPNNNFISFLERSSSRLQTLRLEYIGISEQALIQVLQHNTTSLMELEIREIRGSVCVSDELLSKFCLVLDGQGSGHVLCPRLSSITLARCVQCSNGALAGMLRLRNEEFNHCQLGHVDITFPYNGRHNPEDIYYLAEHYAQE